MAETSTFAASTEPELRRTTYEPRGVLRKNLKALVYLGAALLVIVAAIFSASRKTPGQRTAVSGQPLLQDNTDNNVQDLKNQLAEARLKQQQQAAAAAAMRGDPALAGGMATPTAGYGPSGVAAPCLPGQPCPQAGYGQQQLTPEQQQEQQLAAKDRELAHDARFASNLAYSRSPDSSLQQRQPGQGIPNAFQQSAERTRDPNSSLIAPRAAGDPTGEGQEQKRPLEVNLDSAAGPPYVLFEGTTMDTVLMNRLDGDAPGPVKVLVSNPVYSHDHQHVIVPDGTIVLGEARKIGATGFGQQRRIAVIFHRMIMPDGYSVDLDQFQGLNQIGEQGLKDKVNNHYLQIFGISIALGIIAGAAEIEQGGGALTGSGSQTFTNGTAASVSQSATSILDRFIQIPPTITIREGHRVKVYFTQDLLLPAYTNHTIPQTF